MQDVGIQQISASYEPEQDRIMLRLRTANNAEIRCWITRRYLRLLWGVLLDLARGFAGGGTVVDPLHQDYLADFAHGNALANADFATPFQEGVDFPLGAEPFLAGKITLKPRSDALRTLVIEPLKGPGVELNLNEGLTHMLARLLLNATLTADWDLGLRLDFSSVTQGETKRSALH